MEHLLKLKLGSEVSLVVCPTDDYTTEIYSGKNITVFLKDSFKKPLRKSDGYYVFTDLPEGAYQIVMHSDIYLSEEVQVTPMELSRDCVFYLKLKPHPAYPFPGGATLVRASIRDIEGNLAKSAEVKAVILSEDSSRARLMNQTTQNGSYEVSLANVIGKILVGDVFLIKEKGGEKMEYCRIVDILKGTQRYKLEAPLQHEYRKGALLLPVMQTRTDDRGEVVVYLRSLRSKTCDARLEFTYNNRTAAKEVRLEEGKTVYLGVVEV